MLKKITNNWLFCLVFCGLIIGSSLRLIFNRPEVAEYLFLVTLIVGGAPLVYKTLRGMLQGKFATDILAMLSIITALLMNEAFPGVIIVLMQSGGEALERYGLNRASFSIKQLMERAPKIARRKKEGQLQEVHVEEIQVGEILIVRPGDLVPLDGTITEGRAFIDESAITGEPLARVKGVGEMLMSGSVNVGDAFEMRADRVASQSQYAKIVALVLRAQNEKAPIQRMADRYAQFFTPLALLVAAMGYFITGDRTTILSVFVVATPCPLILAVPVAVLTAMNRAALRGIIVKTGSAIEQVGRADCIVFDKTGTLTFGTPFVEEVIPINGYTSNELLYKAASLEQLSSHTVAQAIVKKGREQFEKLVLPTNFREVPGKGVMGYLGEDEVRIGSRPFVENKEHAHTHAKGSLSAFIVVNEKPAGEILFTDKLRPEAHLVIARLKTLGIKMVAMITGDGSPNAQVIAEEAGIKEVTAELLPEQKVAFIQNLKKRFTSVVMVGDGINDAPALATATVGVAMGAHGTAVSAEAADVVLLVDDLTRVGDLIEIGRRMLYIARESIYVGMGCSLILMLIAAYGYIPPAIGALLQEVLDAVVILNALRARS